MNQANAMTVTSKEVTKANGTLGRMRGALRSWLNYRLKNDLVLAGKAPKGREGKIKSDGKLTIARARDTTLEQKLATQLHTLLSETFDGARLPSPDLRSNPHAAVELAQIALGDRAIATSQGPVSVGQVPWLAVAIVGGILLTITTAIKTNADLAAEKERIACIQAGACTDYGFWLKACALLGIGWFAWTQMGLREKVRSMTK